MGLYSYAILMSIIYEFSIQCLTLQCRVGNTVLTESVDYTVYSENWFECPILLGLF